MLDLTTVGAHSFWNGYDRATIYRIICLIESSETWVVDEDPKIQGALNCLAKVIDSFKGNIPNNLESLFITVIANIKMSKAVRLLQALEQLSSGFPAKLLMYAEETSNPDNKDTYSKYSEIFLKRNLIFERMQLLSRTFSFDRLNMITNTFEVLYDD